MRIFHFAYDTIVAFRRRCYTIKGLIYIYIKQTDNIPCSYISLKMDGNEKCIFNYYNHY